MFLIHDNQSVDVAVISVVIISMTDNAQFDVTLPVVPGELLFARLSDYETAKAFRNAIHEVVQIYDHANEVEGFFPGEPLQQPPAYELVVERTQINCLPVGSEATHFEDNSFSVPVQPKNP